MKEIMVIEGNEIERVEYQGQPVLSLPMVDKLHQRPEGSARKNFNNNRDYFTEGEDYIVLPYEEWSVLVGKNLPDQEDDLPDQNESKGGHRGNMLFLFLSGYLQLATTFTDALAWKIRKVLVKSYFKLRELQFAAKDMLALKAKADAYDALMSKYTGALESIISLKDRLIADKRRINLTDEEKETIISLAKQGLTTTPIMNRTGRSKSAVQSVLRLARECGILPPFNAQPA
jgi:hypothetical protein